MLVSFSSPRTAKLKPSYFPSSQIGEREDKNKFTLIHPGGGAIKLKADNAQDADGWVNVITTSIKEVTNHLSCD